MGIPKRHPGAPYLGGEILTGPDLEQDIVNLIEEFGLAGETEGKLDNSNFAPDADLDGLKFLDASMDTLQLKLNSVDGKKILAGALTTAKFLDATVPTEKFKDGEFYQTARGDSSVLPYSTTPTATDVATAALTTGPTTSKVLLLAWLEVGQQGGAGANLEVGLYRDGSLLRELDDIDIEIAHTMAFHFPWLETAHTAETAHTWQLRVSETGAGSGAFIVLSAHLNVIELKR